MDQPSTDTREQRDRPHDDEAYMTGGMTFQTDCSVLRSTSKYLNSPVLRETSIATRACASPGRTSSPPPWSPRPTMRWKPCRTAAAWPS